MSSNQKPPRWCGKCRAAHSGACPVAKLSGWANKVKARRDGRGGRPWQRKREAVFARDGYLCQIHKVLGVLVAVELHGPNHGVLDHEVPLSQGGTDDMDNLQTICQECDKIKTARESANSRRG